MILSKIPQKIKAVIRRLFKKREDRAVEPVPIETKAPLINPLDFSSFPAAIEFALSAAGISADSAGIGIALPRGLTGVEKLMDYICPRFKRVTVYTDDPAAEDIADGIYGRFGLPIMLYGSKDFARCRQTLTADIGVGALRFGRDLCIVGTDESGELVRG